MLGANQSSQKTEQMSYPSHNAAYCKSLVIKLLYTLQLLLIIHILKEQCNNPMWTKTQRILC